MKSYCRSEVLDYFESQYPKDVQWADAINAICDKNPKFAKIMDPDNERKFAVSETNSKRLMLMCCKSRPSDRGYLERATKRHPLTFHWVKNERKV